jgi:UDP-2-acetamido-2-deoxy-ribo-hexuluronate aminotransferase
MHINFIDLQKQYKAIEAKVNARIQKVLDHSGYILGPEVEECEKNLAAYVGTKHAITCSSGTDALVMALMALDIKAGDEVITTPFTFVATAEAIVLVGATPVFVDVEKETYNINPKLIEKAITAKTKAIMPVSLYGQTPDMDEINAIAKRHKLTVIEDAAQSFGAEFKGKKSCNLSDIGCTSFFPAKPLGCYGDGGAVFTNNDKWATAMKEIRVHGQSARYFHPRLGINGRLDTLQCAILIEKLARFPWEVEQRVKLGARYTQAFQDLGAKVQLPKVMPNRLHVYGQYTLVVNNREKFQADLKEKNVPTAVHYPRPLNKQPAYEKYSTTSFAVSEELSEKVVSLPMYPDLDTQTQDYIINAVKTALQ